MTPPFPARLRWFLYGCSQVAYEDEVELSGGKVQQRRGSR